MLRECARDDQDGGRAQDPAEPPMNRAPDTPVTRQRAAVRLVQPRWWNATRDQAEAEANSTPAMARVTLPHRQHGEPHRYRAFRVAVPDPAGYPPLGVGGEFLGEAQQALAAKIRFR